MDERVSHRGVNEGEVVAPKLRRWRRWRRRGGGRRVKRSDKAGAIAGRNGGQKWGGNFIERVAGVKKAGQKRSKKEAREKC